MNQIRLLIADNRPLLVDLLCQVCADDDVTVVGVEGRLAALVDRCRATEANVLLVSGHLVGDEVAEIIPLLLAQSTRVLALADDANPEVASVLLFAGAAGFLISHDTTPHDLRRAIATVAKGHPALHPAAALAVLHQWRTLRANVEPAPSASRGIALSARELDVLSGMAKGLSTRIIATRLGVAVKTVEAHRSRIFVKLGVRTQAHAISMARAQGLTDGIPRGD